MKQRLLVLLVLVVAFPGLVLSATDVVGAPVTFANNQAGMYLSYFPLVSKQPASCSAAPLPPVVWDSRLGPGAAPPLDQVRIIQDQVAPCQRYWRVVVVKYEDPSESGNDHTIYVKVLDEYATRAVGERLHVTGSNGLSEYPNEKPAGDLCNCNFDFPLFGDAYSVHIDGALPSDTMAGMVMPFNQHVNYRITFQRVLNPG